MAFDPHDDVASQANDPWNVGPSGWPPERPLSESETDHPRAPAEAPTVVPGWNLDSRGQDRGSEPVGAVAEPEPAPDADGPVSYQPPPYVGEPVAVGRPPTATAEVSGWAKADQAREESPAAPGPWTTRAARPMRSPEETRRRRRRAGAFVAFLVVAIGIGVAIGAWIAPTSPSAVAGGLVTSSVAAAQAAGTYHYVQLSTTAGQRYDISGDATPDGGRQVIEQTGTTGNDVFDLRLVHGIVYFRGNAAAVVDQLGIPITRASAVVDAWVSVTSKATVYKKFEVGITTSSNLSQIKKTFVAQTSAPIPGSSPARTRILGGIYLGKGKTPGGAATMTIDTSSRLPRTLNGQLELTSGAFTLTWQFSHFGEHVTLGAPSGAIPLASLQAQAGG